VGEALDGDAPCRQVWVVSPLVCSGSGRRRLAAVGGGRRLLLTLGASVLLGAEADERHGQVLVKRLGDEGAVGAVGALDAAEDCHDRTLPQLGHGVEQRRLQQDAVQGKGACE